MNCLIVGAGQLGSRHLQGLLKFSKSNLEIFVVDPNIDSLNTAKLRANEIQNTHTVNYFKNTNEVPYNIKFAIVATSSNVRENITLDLLKKFEIEFLILEKVLFTNIKAYNNIENVLNKSKTICFVNHPRRLLKEYEEIKYFLQSEKKLTMQVVGANWGLACNGLHFLDIFEYLSNSKLKKLKTTFLDNNIIKSKRDGFIEITGALTGILENSNTLILNSIDSINVVAPQISIMGENKKVIVQETGSHSYYILFDSINNYEIDTKIFQIKFQSELTNNVLEQLVIFKTCNLTPFHEATQTHQIFIKKLLKFYNKKNNDLTNSILPIT